MGKGGAEGATAGSQKQEDGRIEGRVRKKGAKEGGRGGRGREDAGFHLVMLGMDGENDE